MPLIKRVIIVTIIRVKIFFTFMDVTLDETKSFYMCPHLPGKRSIEIESLKSSFLPFGTPSTLPGTSHMDASKPAS